MKIWKLSVKKIPKIPKECKGGDCFEISGRYIMDQYFLGKKDLYLCHGTVTGQRRIEGVQYDHAWIEDGDLCIDKSCGRNIQLPKAIYYISGQIENVKRYNYEEMSHMINQYGHWGPWE